MEQYLRRARKLKNIRLILELKAHETPERNREAAQAVVKLVKRMRLAKRTDYISFNLDACKEFIRLCPKSEVSYLNGELSPMELKELQERVDAWIKTVGVRYFNELTNTAVLMEEVGELARVMARKYGEQSFKPGERDNLAEEMADVLWVLVCLANQTGVDLTEAIEASFAKKTARDIKRHKNNPKLR